MRARIAFSILLAAVVLPQLAGCQKVVGAVTPEPSVVTQEATAAASGAEVEGTIPDGFPDDLPVWPGATIKNAEATDFSQSLILTTTEAYSDVVAGVAVGFERAGWSVAEVSKEASATAIEVATTGYEGFVTVYDSPNGARIEYLLTPTE